MATVGFVLCRPSVGSMGSSVRVREKPILTGFAENQGALLTTDVNDNFVACTTDPTQVAAVSVTPGGADSGSITPGFIIIGRREFPPNTMQGYTLDDQPHFYAPFLGTIPTVTGNNYGVTRDTDNCWKVDFTKTDKPVVQLVDIPQRSPADASGAGQNQIVEVVFLQGVVQLI